MTAISDIAAVVIGRNEGERLRLCLASILGRVRTVVYIDSGSSDGSVALARSMGAKVHELTTDRPFTAARARNAGVWYLLNHVPPGEASPVYIQFVDGDCELVDGWLEAAAAALAADTELAVVCGRRRERFPDATIYNRLCDMEWNTPIGMAKACGGDFMIRLNAFQSVGGFNPALIAGEEPELCFRLRAAGWKLYRIDEEMTLHDAAIHHFSQWATRMQRSGWAFVAGAALHGQAPEYYNVRDTLRIIFWALFLPLIVTGLIFLSLYASTDFIAYLLFFIFIYFIQIFRVAFYRVKKFGDSFFSSLQYAYFIFVGKFYQLFGVVDFIINHIRKRDATIIEYKI